MTNRFDRGISPNGPREKLLKLGVPAEYVDLRLDVLTKAATLDDLRREFHERHFTCDEEQFLLPMFRPAFVSDSNLRKQVLDQLEQTGIPRRLIRRYLTRMGNQPYVLFHLGYEESFSREVRVKFTDTAQQVILDGLKNYLGLTLQPQK